MDDPGRPGCAQCSPLVVVSEVFFFVSSRRSIARYCLVQSRWQVPIDV